MTEETAMVLLEDSEEGTDPSTNESKQLNANIYRAASALLEIYDRLGALDLALAVAEIRAAILDGDTPVFTPEAAEILSSHYKNIPFNSSNSQPRLEPASENSNLPPEPVPADSDRASKIAPKPKHSWVNGGTIGMVAAGMALTGASYKADSYQHAKYQRAKDSINSAIRKSIILRTTPELTLDQQRHLLELQEIVIPNLKEHYADSKPDSTPLAFMLGGVLIALLGVGYGIGTAKRKEKTEEKLAVKNAAEEAQKEAHRTEHRQRTEAYEAHLTEHRMSVMSSINEVINNACANSHPPITLYDLPSRA